MNEMIVRDQLRRVFGIALDACNRLQVVAESDHVDQDLRARLVGFVEDHPWILTHDPDADFELLRRVHHEAFLRNLAVEMALEVDVSDFGDYCIAVRVRPRRGAVGEAVITWYAYWPTALRRLLRDEVLDRIENGVLYRNGSMLRLVSAREAERLEAERLETERLEAERG